jgi:thioredoxin-like negative regulator of GroEL
MYLVGVDKMRDSAFSLNEGETPEVLFFLFLTGGRVNAVEAVIRRALKKYPRPHHFAIYDVEKFPTIAERFGVVATPTLIMDDLVHGGQSRLIGMPGSTEIREFLVRHLRVTT